MWASCFALPKIFRVTENTACCVPNIICSGDTKTGQILRLVPFQSPASTKRRLPVFGIGFRGKDTDLFNRLYTSTQRQPLPNRRQPLPHHFASETFEGQRTLSECKLAGTKIHKPEKDETPSLSDPGPLNVRCPHSHRVQSTEAGGCIVKPNRKKTMEKIVCIGERSWQRLLERVEHLSALAQRLERRLTPPQDDG